MKIPPARKTQLSDYHQISQLYETFLLCLCLLQWLENADADGGSLLSLESMFIFWEKLLKVMKEHPVEHSFLRMPLARYSSHSKGDISKNRPMIWESLNILISFELSRFWVKIKMKMCKLLFTFYKMRRLFIVINLAKKYERIVRKIIYNNIPSIVRKLRAFDPINW